LFVPNKRISATKIIIIHSLPIIFRLYSIMDFVQLVLN
jgi:hypothetical protein